ncbi:MAG: hypothetical protein AAGI68_13925 [Planctomycetota bacterium]
MQDLRPTPDARRPRRQRLRTRHSGSAIILVVISVILLALLGATYLQITRFERLANPEQGNIEIVFQSILTKAATTLGEDIVQTNDLAFDPGDGIEPYDYDHVRSTGITTQTVLAADHGGTFNPSALIEVDDDPWLGSAFLTGGLYRNITNLCGYFIDLDANGGLPDNLNYARAQQADITPQVIDGTTAVAVTSQFADTDDDGLADARWAWPPIFEVGGIRYVFAIRIVDLSARVNLNTASIQLDTTPASGAYGRTTNAAETPRGTNPSELSLGGFVYDSFSGTLATQRQFADDAESIIEARYGLGGTFPRPYLTEPTINQYDRLAYWENGGSRLRADGGLTPPANLSAQAITYVPFPLLDTAELLTRNGLSDGAASSSIESADEGGGTPDDLLRTTIDESGTTGDAYGAAPGDFFTTEARKWLTTHSGVGDFAMPTPTGTALDTQLNVNGSTAAQIAANLADLGYTPDAGTNDAAFANHLAASIKDFADTDNRPTLVDTQYGFEPLPMITEVYLQVPYLLGTPTPNAGGGQDVPISRTNAGDIGYAIEIGNPFSFPIPLENVTLNLGGNPVGTLDTLTGAPAELLPGESLVIKGPNGAFNAPGPDPDVTTTNATEISLNESFPDGGTEVTLEVATQTGGSVVYHRFSTPSIIQSETIVDWIGDGTNGNAAPAAGQVHHRVFRRYGYFTGLDLLRVGSGTNTELPAEDDAEPFQNYLFYDGAASELGEAKQTPPAGNFVDGAAPEQVIVRDEEGIDYIADIALVMGVGPTTTLTLPEVWQDQTSLADHRLPDPADTATLAGPILGSAEDAYQVNFSTLAMARLSTISPRNDGVDNDDSNTADDDSENFIGGKININTAPGFLIESTLPIPDGGLRTDIADAILEMRDYDATVDPLPAGRTRTNPGLAYIGELFARAELNPFGGDGTDNLTWPGLTNMQLDWNTRDANGDGTIDAADADGIVDDLEERLMIARWLPQMYSTRSDVYAAYVLINGYDGGTLTETLRAVVIFQRANVREGGDLAEVLAVVRF